MKSSRVSIPWLTLLACVSAAVLVVARPYAADSELKVKAVAHQWWWEFEYPSLGIKTSNVLYLPSDTDIQLELRSADAIHSFWIAGMKRSIDIIPGRARLFDFLVKAPGELDGNCDSGCGCGTVCMRFRVLASAPPEFERWMASARLDHSEFKPPGTVDTPACALNSSGAARVKPNSPASRLQQLLDKGSTAHSG
jgi:cytochrome c oxidase subunit II